MEQKHRRFSSVRAAVPIWMGADQHLMLGKILLCKGKPQLLGVLGSETIFIPISGIKADDIVVSFDLGTVLIFAKMIIGAAAFHAVSHGRAVDALQQK